ncbi:MAG TPA: hypothetical protein VEH84_19400 [Alphaproteobacteria bacterium]|nr:hypothetical protein [Alphaproteobacteria bacterium]
MPGTERPNGAALALAAALLLGGCAAPAARMATGPAPAIESAAAYAVFDDMLAEMGRDASLRQFCLGIADTPDALPADPPESLTAALAAEHAGVEPASACRLVRRGGLTVLADGSILLLFGQPPPPPALPEPAAADAEAPGPGALLRGLAFGAFRRSDCGGPLSGLSLYRLDLAEGRPVVGDRRLIDAELCEEAARPVAEG